MTSSRTVTSTSISSASSSIRTSSTYTRSTNIVDVNMSRSVTYTISIGVIGIMTSTFKRSSHPFFRSSTTTFVVRISSSIIGTGSTSSGSSTPVYNLTISSTFTDFSRNSIRTSRASSTGSIIQFKISGTSTSVHVTLSVTGGVSGTSSTFIVGVIFVLVSSTVGTTSISTSRFIEVSSTFTVSSIISSSGSGSISPVITSITHTVSISRRIFY